MKASIRVSELKGSVRSTFILAGQNIPLFPGEKEHFVITKEGDPYSLVEALQEEAKATAKKMGIEVDW